MHKPIHHIMFYETRCLVGHPSIWSILQLYKIRCNKCITSTHNECVQSKFTRLTVYHSKKIIVDEPNLFISFQLTKNTYLIHWALNKMTFCRWYFLMNSIEMKKKTFVYLYSNFIGICSGRSNRQYVSIGSAKYFKIFKAITWINGASSYRLI